MARARNIKPGFFKNEILGTADPFVSLLFAGLWTLADKSGILEDRPLRIKAELFPYREGFDINGYLTVLVSSNFIHRYEYDGIKLIQIKNFEKHQNPHHTERASEYPTFSEVYQKSVKQPLNNGDAPADSLLLIPDSLIPDSINTLTDVSVSKTPVLPPTLVLTEIDESKKNQCPVSEIVNLYHEVLPSLPRVEKLTPKRKGYIQQRWREDLKTLDEWRNYFSFVSQSDFLMGRTTPSGDRRPFRATLEWLSKSSSYANIAEEKYHG